MTGLGITNKRVTFALGLIVLGPLLALACTTPDPRAGSGTGRAAAPSSTSGGGAGIDAAAPETTKDCGPAPSATPAFTKQALLGAVAECAAWQTCTFQNAATSLRLAVRADASASTAETRKTAGNAWKTAMGAWSTMELFQFGPVGTKASDPYFGRSLRSFIHAWPDQNRCQIETQIVGKGYAKGWDLVFPNSRGLYGLEYLLFHEGNDTVCLAGSETGKAWSQLDPAALGKAKSDYAVALSDNLVALSLELASVWAKGGEDFSTKLVAATGYGTDQEALNIVAWSLMYLEQEVKDLKLAPRAGVVTTPATSETPFAGIEIENLRTNVRAFRSLFAGCADGQGLGFDDWLTAAGHADLATQILAELAAIQTAADAFPSFGAASEAQFLSLYQLVRPLANLLKASFFGSASPINLKLPASASSDTD